MRGKEAPAKPYTPFLFTGFPFHDITPFLFTGFPFHDITILILLEMSTVHDMDFGTNSNGKPKRERKGNEKGTKRERKGKVTEPLQIKPDRQNRSYVASLYTIIIIYIHIIMINWDTKQIVI